MRDVNRPVAASVRYRLRMWFLLAVCLAHWGCAADENDPGNQHPAILLESEQDGSTLRLTLDRDDITTAESAVLQLDVESAESQSVEFPDHRDGFSDFAVIREEALEERLLEGSRVVRGRRYVLQPFLPGSYELPALTVTIDGTSPLSTEPVEVTVHSVLEDPDHPELQDIAEPVEMPVPAWWWVVGAAVLVALVVTAAWWLKRRRLARQIPRVVTPHEEALAALDQLVASGLPDVAGLQVFYFRLSDIVRRYVEERFGLRAPEQTTEEFLATMVGSPAISGTHQRLLGSFLEQADMVKFARLEPARQEVLDSVEAARKFVRQTIPAEPVLPDAKPGSPGKR